MPLVLHEQNSVPGLANTRSARRAARVCVSLPQAVSAFKDHVRSPEDIVITGNPVRQSVVTASRAAGRAAFGIPEDATMLLVFGGSLGAVHLNRGVCALKDELLGREGLRIVHSTGRDDYGSVVAALDLTEAEQARWQVMRHTRRKR